MDETSIKENIGRERERLGLSQTEMAVRLGMDRNSYRNLEKGPTRIINSNMDKLSDILGVSKERLVLGYEPIDQEHSALHDYQERYLGEKQKMVEEYENRIRLLEMQLNHLNEKLEDLKQTLEAKDSFLQFALKRLEKLEE